MTRCLIVLIGVFLAQTAPAATRYVSTNNASSTPPYDSWDTAATNIQDAVFAATNDVVLVTNGLYTCASTERSGIRAMIIITNSVTLQSVNGPAVTLIDGGNTGEFTNRCLYISHASAVVSGFTITNGRANATNENNRGGGVYLKSYGTLTNCWILGNSTSNAPNVQDAGGTSWRGGGGVYMYNGGTLQNCVIAGNSATNSGGGMFCYGGLVQDCTISNNCVVGKQYETSGGGLCLIGGTAMNCRITMNLSGDYGAGAYVYGLDLGCVLSNCSISFNTNSGQDGGGVYMRGGLVTHCDIFSNKAASKASGVSVDKDHLCVVESCTIRNNQWASYIGGMYFRREGIARNCVIRDNAGGGVFLGIGDHVSRTSLLENCTVVNNSGGGVKCEAVWDTGKGVMVNSISYSNSGGNWITNYAGFSAFNCCTTPTNDLSGTVNITNNPTFSNFPAGNFRLGNGSPCINTGTNQSWMTGATDWDGFPRIKYGIVDIGAHEYIAKGTTVSIQ